MTLVQPREDFVRRVAVGEPNAENSAVIRVWCDPDSCDVYAGISETAGVLKISMHESGICTAGLTTQFVQEQPSVLKSLRGQRSQSRWRRVMFSSPNAHPVVHFAVPSTEVTRWRKRQVRKSSEIVWIPNPKAGSSVVITCGFSAPTQLERGWPGHKRGTQLIGAKLLPNGELFWLVCIEQPTDAVEIAVIEKARERVAREAAIPFEPTQRLRSTGARLTAFRDCSDFEALLVVDMAIVPAP